MFFDEELLIFKTLSKHCTGSPEIKRTGSGNQIFCSLKNS